jgi:hypothetical protein
MGSDWSRTRNSGVSLATNVFLEQGGTKLELYIKRFIRRYVARAVLCEGYRFWRNVGGQANVDEKQSSR